MKLAGSGVMEAGKIIVGDFKIISQCVANCVPQRPLQVHMKQPVKYVALFSQVPQMNVRGKSFKTFIGEAT